MTTYLAVDYAFLQETPYDLDYVLECNDVLNILLTSKTGAKIQIFSNTYLSFRKIEEGHALRLLQELSHVDNKIHAVYRLERSTYIDWFNEQSYEISKERNLRHYIICTVNDIIEIIEMNDLQIREVMQNK